MTLEVELALQLLVPTRRVRVFQRPTPPHNAHSRRLLPCIIGGSDSDGGRAEDPDRLELFDGLVEVQYGGGESWLAMRLTLWEAGDRHYRVVQGVLWYNEGDSHRLKAQVAERLEGEAEVETDSKGDDQGRPAIAVLLATAVHDVMAKFRASNVEELTAINSPRAKFELELLQHHQHLDVGVLRHSQMLFALPLFTADHTTEGVGQDGPEGGTFLPQALTHPVVERGFNKTVVSLLLSTTTGVWAVKLSWPSSLQLSSQVTQLSSATNDATSSVDILSSCQQAFLTQWTTRRDFIGQLHATTLVLEFDAVDFSRVVFALQEQLNPTAPLRVLVLSLVFPPEFFLTRCLADLQVHLLDGHDTSEGVAISLASCTTDMTDEWAHNTPRLVAAFLQSLQNSLVHHLYVF